MGFPILFHRILPLKFTLRDLRNPAEKSPVAAQDPSALSSFGGRVGDGT